MQISLNHFSMYFSCVMYICKPNSLLYFHEICDKLHLLSMSMYVIHRVYVNFVKIKFFEIWLIYIIFAQSPKNYDSLCGTTHANYMWCLKSLATTELCGQFALYFQLSKSISHLTITLFTKIKEHTTTCTTSAWICRRRRSYNYEYRNL